MLSCRSRQIGKQSCFDGEDFDDLIFCKYVGSVFSGLHFQEVKIMPYNKTEKGEAPAKRRPMHRRKKVCVFCGKDNVIDYKDAAKLRKFISERGKILPRRVTGNCAKHQRAITAAVKRARHVAILPYVED